MTAERIKTPRVAEITGLTIRHVQLMAAQGLIPSAAKLGTVWTFDETTLRRWIREQEAAACQHSTNEAQCSGEGSRLPDVSIDRAYELAIGLRRGDGSTRGRRN